MRWIKNHWFGLLISIFLLIMAVYFVIVFSSPRRDAEKRGFIPCTEEMADNILRCNDKKLSCTFWAIIDNNVCNVKIIYTGFLNWKDNKQDKPWSNYLFTPIKSNENSMYDYIADSEDLDDNQAFELAEDLEKIKKLNEELENNEQK